MNNSAPLPKLASMGTIGKRRIGYHTYSVHALLEEIEKRVESIKDYGEGCNCLRGGDCVECNRNIKINSIIKQIQEARK